MEYQLKMTGHFSKAKTAHKTAHFPMNKICFFVVVFNHFLLSETSPKNKIRGSQNLMRPNLNQGRYRDMSYQKDPGLVI